MIGPGEVFTLFFVTLGPLKVLGPFAMQTRGLEPAALRGLALRVFVLSLAALAVGGLIGRHLVHSWHVSSTALLFATGVIFFIVALRVVLEQYEPPHEGAPPPLPAKPMAAALKLVSPTIVTPYGVAALIVLLAAAVATFFTSEMGKELIAYGRDSVREVRKVVWPTRKEALQMTGYVFAFVVVMALFLWLTDKTLEWLLYDLILGWKR